MSEHRDGDSDTSGGKVVTQTAHWIPVYHCDRCDVHWDADGGVFCWSCGDKGYSRAPKAFGGWQFDPSRASDHLPYA